MRPRIPQFSLNTLLLIVTFAAVWCVHVSIQEDDKRAWNEWFHSERVIRGESPVMLSPFLSASNTVILIVAACFYRRYQRLAVWGGIIAAVIATGVILFVAKFLLR